MKIKQKYPLIECISKRYYKRDNMKKLFFHTLFFTIIFSLLSGCTSQMIEVDPLSRKSKVERTNAIFIIGIDFLEKYINQGLGTSGFWSQEKVVLNKENVESKLLTNSKLLLKQPLYHLANFRFVFETNNGNDLIIKRFHKNLLEYESPGLYSIVPGKIKLVKVYYDKYVLKEGTGSSMTNRWKKESKSLESDFGTWQLDAGKVYYLGDFTFYFNTKKREFGLYPTEEVNISINMEGIEYRNNFQADIARLKANRSWFPAEKAINKSLQEKWFFKSEVMSDYTDPVISDSSEDTEPEEERDLEKLFY